jgi:hypothetical protein
MQMMCTYFISYDYVFIQEQSYEHFGSNTCLLTKCPPDDDDDEDVYCSKRAVSSLESVFN